MERTNFETLRVYQLAEQLSDLAWDIVQLWSRLAQDTVGKQLIRAADSIGANLAEGSGRGTRIDNRRFAHIARGSLYETKHWLRRAFRRNLLSDEQIISIKALMDELIRTLNGYIRSLTKPRDTT